MILSASRRTDIPAFYSDWFYRRVEEGFFLVRNPMNTRQVSRVQISPQNVECFVFWTKNPSGSFISGLERLDALGYKYYFQFTVTPYAEDIERNVPHKEEIIRTFISLSERIGREKVIWRYDPILLTGRYSMGYHEERFAYLADRLCGHTEKVIISFIDSYPKIRRRMAECGISELSEEQMRSLAEKLKSVATAHGLPVESCAEKIDLADIGIAHGHCVDGNLVGRICGKKFVFTKAKSQRAGCGCAASIDIGAYDSCRHGCVYCYAMQGSGAPVNPPVDSGSPLLASCLCEDDRVTERLVPRLEEAGPELF